MAKVKDGVGHCGWEVEPCFGGEADRIDPSRGEGKEQRSAGIRILTRGHVSRLDVPCTVNTAAT